MAIKDQKHCQIHFSTQLLSIQHCDEHIKCEVQNRDTHETETLYCCYLIAADGAHSTIRKMLNIPMEGMDNMGEFVSVFSQTKLPKPFVKNPGAVTVFTKPELQGKFVMAVDLKDKWIIAQRTDGITQNIDRNYCINLVRQVAEEPNLSVNIINVSHWKMAALNAQHYRSGRVFLVGDAAHRMPPTGGMGMNTGIHDAHNLAWKLAYVIKGFADDELLNSYQQERQPIAEYTIQWSCRNAERLRNVIKSHNQNDHEKFKHALALQKTQLNHRGLDLGFIYQTEHELDPDNYYPSTIPGARAPH